MNKTFTQAEQASLEEVMRHRRDVRGNNFLSDDISDDKLQKILEAAAYAPSVGFSQPWEFVVIRNPEIKKSIYNNFVEENEAAKTQFEGERSDAYQRLKLEGILEAPVNIAVFYQSSDSPVLGQTSMPEVGEYSVVCAIQNMWLMARALDIGIGWVSILDPEYVKTQLNAPKGHKLIAYLCLGYVKEFYTGPELERLNWAKKKRLESAIFVDKYSDDSDA